MTHALVLALAGVVSAATSTLVATSRARWRSIPAVAGWIRLTHGRTFLGAVFGVAIAAAVSLSISGHSHHVATYLLWYGLAGFAAIGVVVTTAVIERGAGRSVMRHEPTAAAAFVAQATGSRGSGQFHAAAGTGGLASFMSFGGVSITNLQRDRKLSINARVRYTPRGGVEQLGYERDNKGWLNPPQINVGGAPVDILTCPTSVQPEQSVVGDILFAFATHDLAILLDELQLELELYDRISGEGTLVPRIGEAYSTAADRWA